MNRIRRNLAVLAVAGLAAFAMNPADAARPAVEVELEESNVFIEWNSTADDYGVHFFWDGDPWTAMTIRNERGRTVLNITPRSAVKTQGLTEAFFESSEPPTSELSREEFFARFPEGEYEFQGTTLEGEVLAGEADFTHVLASPPTHLFPSTGDVVSRNGFTASFDPVTKDVDGNPVAIGFYEVIVEKADDDPILQSMSVILRPSQSSLAVPAQFLEAHTEYKMEVIAVEEGGNKTITESGKFTTD